MVIFSSVGGTTRKVAERVAARVGDECIFDARTALSLPPPRDNRIFVLCCPAYGDGELEDSFETLLLEYEWADLSGAAFGFCELGIYTGYEDLGHGLAVMVQRILVSKGLRELVPPLSIDAVPITDWAMVDLWSDQIAYGIAASNE
jgi:flavodoxin